MSEKDSYQEFLELIEKHAFHSKIDAYILHALADVAAASEDVNGFSVPMLVHVENDRVDLSNLATVYGSIKNIIALSATPAQLINLLKLPEVINMEASLPNGTDESVNDPNYIAYNKNFSQGFFDDLSPGTFVAYINGEFVGSAASHEELVQLDQVKNAHTSVFIHQVDMPEVTYDIPSVLSIE